jgi:N-acetylglucosaminyldiphosphoundecaprenol N-acetyl-beta-D-mannosaminyltransferase
MKTFYIFGTKINSVTFAEVTDCIDDFTRSNKPHLIVTLGAEMLINSINNIEFKEIVNSADIVTADGVGVIWANRQFGNEPGKKIAGVELIDRICKEAVKKSWRIFLLGATEEAVVKTSENLKFRHKGLEISGYNNGFFSSDKEMIKKINLSKTQILFCALGSPKQELWYKKNKDKLNISVCIGVGGSFDIISGLKKRAPGWMINSGLEWLYRLICEPKRFMRMLAIPKLIFLVYKAKFFKK